MLRSASALLEMMKRDKENGCYHNGEAVIPSNMYFQTIDGFIRFARFVIEELWTDLNQEWKNHIWEVFSMMNKLQDANTAFISDNESFDDYCTRVSKILENSYPELSVEVFRTNGDDLIGFLEKYEEKGRVTFCYEDVAEIEQEYKPEIKKQLQGLKMSKQTSERNFDVSFYLMGRYHEHVYDAINILIQSVVYSLNCSSARNNECNWFDVERLENDMKYAASIIERIAVVK